MSVRAASTASCPYFRELGERIHEEQVDDERQPADEVSDRAGLFPPAGSRFLSVPRKASENENTMRHQLVVAVGGLSIAH